MAPTPHAVPERVARWGMTGRPPKRMVDAMTKHLIHRLRPNRSQEDGDPDRAAQVILDVVDLGEPPLRLLLGSDPLARAADIIERQSAEDRKWALVSERTDFEELGA
jgi:hypothetical protein